MTLVRAVDCYRRTTCRAIASQQGMCSLEGRCLIERNGDQHFGWSEPMWSPPPESNRRPHPYHGTTRNRCADRHFPRSRPTVGAKVIGSLLPRLCARFKLILIVSGSSHPCTTNAFIGVSSRCLPQCHTPPLGLDVEPLQGGPGCNAWAACSGSGRCLRESRSRRFGRSCAHLPANLPREGCSW
jgi:hypothetical protein